MPRGFCSTELVVQAAQDIVGFLDLARDRAKHGDRDRHEQRRRDSFP
ncbi:MAG TPA: hypothetical protein VHI98_04505 [Vicinamibacterales bacterium]|jgi:hypothetical protein|nr:hypothetical protein [Vicinamibacterales bacterium]